MNASSNIVSIIGMVIVGLGLVGCNPNSEHSVTTEFGKVSLDVWEVTRNATADVVLGAADFSRPEGEGWKREWTDKEFAKGVSAMREADGGFVRLGNGLKGLSAAVSPLKPIAIQPNKTYCLNYDGRLPKQGGGFLVLLRLFDKDGRNISQEEDEVAKFSYTATSKALYNNQLNPSKNEVWQAVKIPFTTSAKVASVLPIIAVWEGTALDCRRIAVTEHIPTSERKLASDEADLSVTLSAKRDEQGFYAVSATIEDVANPPRPRALKVALKVERDLTGWKVHENWRTDTPIVGNLRQEYVEHLGGHAVSRYPFTAVSKDGEGFAVGTALDELAFEGRLVMTNGICSTYPLGLLPREGRGTKGTLKWLVFPFKGDWGFRSAARAYYDHEGGKIPEWGKDRKQGCWVWPTLPSRLPKDHDDFGLTLWEAMYNIFYTQPYLIDEAHRKGIQIYPYTEVWGMRQKIETRPDGSRPTTEELMAEIKGWAEEQSSTVLWDGEPRNLAARVCLNSMPICPDGTHPFQVDKYAYVAQWWRTNPDPRLKERPSRASHCWDRTIGPFIDRVDGVYLDSVTYGVVDYNNVRPEHLAVMTENLIWDPETAMPCANGMHHQVAFVSWLASRLHPLNKRIFGNAFKIAQRFHATTADVFGGEVGHWGAANGEERMHRVESDADACEKRFFARHRPISNLLQEGCFWRDAPELSAKGVENYIEHHLFYGFYPAITTIGGGSNVNYKTWYRYLATPSQYERDRAVFKKAIPLIRALNAAGWQPETFLRSSNKDVWVERYGSTKNGGACYFTVRNDSDREHTVELTLDATDEVAFAALKSLWKLPDPVKTANSYRVTLPPWATAVYEVVK